MSDVPFIVIEEGRLFFVWTGIAVTVCHADILQQDVDAIVNAANGQLMHSGGLAYAISKAAGPKMDRECRKIVKQQGNVVVGEVVVTSAGQLPKAKYIIHAVGPDNRVFRSHEACRQVLVILFTNCFAKANDISIASLAIPSVSSGKLTHLFIYV